MLRLAVPGSAKASPAGTMREASNDLMKLLDKGRYERRKDKAYIEENIARLGNGERAYINGVSRLRDSGELAVPYLIGALQDPGKAPIHDSIRRALVDLGRLALSPLLASTEMKDETTLITVIGVLQQIGYETSVPNLADRRRQSPLLHGSHCRVKRPQGNGGRHAQPRCR